MAVYAALFYIILGRRLKIYNRPPQYKYDSNNFAVITDDISSVIRTGR